MVTYSSISKQGSRFLNEDCVGMHQNKERYGFFLADGLGGYAKGEVASQEAVKAAIQYFCIGRNATNILQGAFESGYDRINEIQQIDSDRRSMKTTMTALVIEEQEIQWGHIGDSRIYYFQDEKLVSRTIDHSVPQMLAMAGIIQEKEIRFHVDRNRLLHVLGSEGDREAYVLSERVPRYGRQAFLLCTDGFWELIDERKMQRLLRKTNTVEEWLSEMEKAVGEAGRGKDMDNYSAIAIWVLNKK